MTITTAELRLADLVPPDKVERRDGRFRLQYPIDESVLAEVGEVQAWLVGLLAADGCVTGDRVVSIRQSGAHGKELVQIVQALLGHRAPISTHHRTNFHGATITSKELVAFLGRFNVIPRKSLDRGGYGRAHPSQGGASKLSSRDSSRTLHRDIFGTSRSRRGQLNYSPKE